MVDNKKNKEVEYVERICKSIEEFNYEEKIILVRHLCCLIYMRGKEICIETFLLQYYHFICYL